MSQVTSLHQRWMKGDEYRNAFDALAPEFELARAIIHARATVGFVQGAAIDPNT